MSDTLLILLTILKGLHTERCLSLLPAFELAHSPELDFKDIMNATNFALDELQKTDKPTTSLLPDRFFSAFHLRGMPQTSSETEPVTTMEWYSINLELPVYQLCLGILTTDQRFTPSQTSALVHFTASLVYITQLRDYGTLVYRRAEITPADTNKLKNAAAAYLAREKLYFGLADDNLRQMIDESKGATVSSMAEVDALIRKVSQGHAKTILASISMHDWLLLLNKEVSALYASLNNTIKRLAKQSDDLLSPLSFGQPLDSDVEHSFTTISSLPLFRGLSESQLRNLLKGARITEIPKNTSIMSQGDPLSRLIILLDGWIKTTKESADGRECIVQILGKKEAIFDINCLTSNVTSVNAKTVSKSKVLALSLPVLRDHISRNHKLSVNILSATTQRLQKLVAQYEQITLKDAIQRVGWFLVNLNLETGLEGAPLKLPFDKALIAAYLNIKPETFSRTLSHFKKEGFTIEKDQISLPTPQALCKYCDPDTSLRCGRAEAENCGPIKAAKRLEGR